MKTIKWTLDPSHSELGFKIRHLMITNVSGAFASFRAEAATEGEDFNTAQINVSVDMDSITTHNKQRDAHLLNSDFFEVDKFPELKFQSTKMEAAGPDSFLLRGELTMKGVTQPVTLDVEFGGVTRDPWGSDRAGFTVSGKIRRSDWGVNFNSVLETGGVALGEEVKIHGELQMVKEVVAVPA